MFKRLSALVLALVLVPIALSAIQYTFESSMTPAFVPNVTTAVVTRTVYINKLYLANKHTSAVTVTLTDRSTNCGGAGCPLWPTVQMDPNSVSTIDMMDVPATEGFTWVANTASAVVGWAYYRY